MNAIIEYQKEFFIDGDDAKLKPMILKDIANKTGSIFQQYQEFRTVNTYKTHFGIYPLKYFFV
jgi:RNA polymerase sigma-54 factor